MNVSELVEEAMRHTHDVTPAGRHVGVVLLDGAVEAAIAACLARYGDAVGDRDKLADLHSRLMESLSEPSRAKISTWRDVKQLRQIRNQSQHRQIAADSATVQDLEQPVRRYIETIVMETFQVSLSGVTQADSIADPKLKERVDLAERHIKSGSYHDAYKEVTAIFAEFTRKLTGYHKPWDHRDDSLDEHLYRFTQLAPLAPSLNELGWFERTRMLGAERTESEARRALRFLVGVIVRWEQSEATAALLADRENEAQRPPPSSDGRPRVSGLPEVRFGSAERTGVDLWFRLSYGLAGAADDELGRWHQAIGAALREDSSVRSSVQRSPVPGIRFHEVEPEEVGSALDSVQHALISAVSHYERVEREATERSSAVVQRVRSLESRRQSLCDETPAVGRVLVSADVGPDPILFDLLVIADSHQQAVQGVKPAMGHIFWRDDGRACWALAAKIEDEDLRRVAHQLVKILDTRLNNLRKVSERQAAALSSIEKLLTSRYPDRP